MYHCSFLPFGTRMLVTVKGVGSWCKKAWLPTCELLPGSRQLSVGGGEMGLESRLCQDLTTTTPVSSEPGSSHLWGEGGQLQKWP